MKQYDKEASDALHQGAMQVQNAPEGQRNDTLNKVSFPLGRSVGDERLDRTHVENVLEDAALAAGLDIDEARATIKSGLNAGIKANYDSPTAIRRQVSMRPSLPATRWVPRLIIITKWPDKRSPRSGQQVALALVDFVEMFASPQKLASADASQKDGLAMWNAGEFEDDYRSIRSLQKQHLLLFDIDDGNVTREDIHEALNPLSFLAHTTFTHTPESPRWRVAILTSRPMTPEEYRTVWRKLAERFPGVDMKTGDPGRGFFVPVERPGYEYKFIDGTSDLVLDVDAILTASASGAADASAVASLLPTIKIGRLEELLAGDWLVKKPLPRRMLLRLRHALKGHAGELFPIGKIGMIAGAGGTCKTMLVVSLAISVATGRPWLGLFEVAHAGDVLLVVGEEDLDEIVRRLQQITNTMDLTEEERLAIYKRIHLVPAYGCDVRISESTQPTAMMTQLLTYMSESGADFSLIVLDPAVRFMGGKAEVDAGEATRYIEALERLTEAPGGPVVLTTHHVSKSAMRTYDADQGGASRQLGARGRHQDSGRRRPCQHPQEGLSAAPGRRPRAGRLPEDDRRENQLHGAVLSTVLGADLRSRRPQLPRRTGFHVRHGGRRQGAFEHEEPRLHHR